MGGIFDCNSFKLYTHAWSFKLLGFRFTLAMAKGASTGGLRIKPLLVLKDRLGWEFSLPFPSRKLHGFCR